MRATTKDSANEPLSTGGRFRLLMLAAFMIGSPFLVADSRSPQPADLVLVVLMVSVFFGSTVVIHRPLATMLRPAGLFVFYALLVTAAWAFFLADVTILQYPVFYLYNLLVLITALALYSHYGLVVVRYLTVGAAVSIAIQFVAALALSSGGFRETIFTNNPNQLGYFALLAATVVLLGGRITRIHPVIQLLVFAMATYLTFVSLSAAAIIGIAILGVVTLVSNPRVALGLVLLVSLVYISGVFGPVLQDPTERATTAGQRSDDSLGRRGFDRIVLYPEHLPFGAAEGAWQRFPESEQRNEIHSTWGAILFSYGLPGSVLFIWFLYRLYRLAGARQMLFLLPSVFYGLAHQGLRQTELWLIFGVIACAGLERSRLREAQEMEEPSNALGALPEDQSARFQSERSQPRSSSRSSISER